MGTLIRTISQGQIPHMPRTRHLAVRRVWVQRPHGPRWSVSQLLIPSPWWWGAYVGMATAPMVTGMEGYAGAGHGPHHHHHRHALHLLTTSHTTNTAIRAHGHHAIWLMTANGPPPISVIQTSGSSSAMACIHPHPSVHHPSAQPYAMAVGSIRREGHGANGGRDGGPYTTMAYTTTSTTTTYGR